MRWSPALSQFCDKALVPGAAVRELYSAKDRRRIDRPIVLLKAAPQLSLPGYSADRIVAADRHLCGSSDKHASGEGLYPTILADTVAPNDKWHRRCST
jgi:hypothetical protein